MVPTLVTNDANISNDDAPGALALMKRVGELERAVRDKDELLTRERRLRARLEAAHDAKDRFLAVLSHDLRTPLNAVLGWTQLLRREMLDQSARDRALATIERNALAQLRVLEDLLDISRLTSDGVQLERVPLDFVELVQRCGETVAASARERGVELTVSASAEDLLLVSGDRRRLERAVATLLSNALALTPNGGRVSVDVARKGEQARVTVAHTGRGIAPELLPHVFDPFRQGAELATLGAVDLGLYLVRQAVEVHGGIVFAESDGAESGARFTVLVPADMPSSHVLPCSDKLGSSEASCSRDVLEGVGVLVVEDEDDARELMTTILRQRGAAVTAVTDVATAVRCAKRTTPAVVVTGIALGESGGRELLGELRGRPSSPTLVAVSGFVTTGDIDRLLATGFDLHLAKPIEPAGLVETVRRAAAARRDRLTRE